MNQPFAGDLRPADYEKAQDYAVEQIGNLAEMITDDPDERARFLQELGERLLNIKDNIPRVGD